MKFHIPSSLLVSQLLFTLTLPMTASLPMRFSIVKPNKECLYTSAAKSEFITTSLFIVDGTDLKAKMSVQGPIAPTKISSSAEVLAASLRYDKSARDLVLHEEEDIDFETIYEAEVKEEMLFDDDYYNDDDDFEDDIDDAMYEEYYYMDDDDEYEFMEDDSMDDVELTEIRKAKAERDNMDHMQKEVMKKQRKDDKLKKFQEIKEKKEMAKRKRAEQRAAEVQRKAVLKERMMAKVKDGKIKEQLRAGEPLQKTYEIEKDGWYRFCISPSNNVIEVEMELRKSSEVGKPNTKTGHLETYEHHDMKMHEKNLLKRMEKSDKNEEENGIKEKDLHATKQQVAKLNKLLYEIKEKQQFERHRLSAHKAVNEHSHSRMVLNSLFETIFYIAVSGFQVYTIRKWFSGAPILGY